MFNISGFLCRADADFAVVRSSVAERDGSSPSLAVFRISAGEARVVACFGRVSPHACATGRWLPSARV